MSEEETKQKDKEADKTDAKDDADKGDKSATSSPLEQASATVKRMEELDKSLGEKVAKLEEMQAIDKISGTTTAGSVEGKKEETNQEYKDRIEKAGWKDDRKT